MKIIEALKKQKDLQRKADDLVSKIGKYCVHLNTETPTYDNQKEQVAEWIQAHGDLIKEILKLRIGIQRTNLAIQVPIEIAGKTVTKYIAEWIHRRRELAVIEIKAWNALGDKGLREGVGKNTQGEEFEQKIIRCYDPKKRDAMTEILGEEPSLVDSALEVANAVNDLIEN